MGRVGPQPPGPHLSDLHGGHRPTGKGSEQLRACASGDQPGDEAGRIMRRLWRWMRRESADAALAAEMRDHMAEKVDDLVDAGMTRAAASAISRHSVSVAATSGDTGLRPA